MKFFCEILQRGGLLQWHVAERGRECVPVRMRWQESVLNRDGLIGQTKGFACSLSGTGFDFVLDRSHHEFPRVVFSDFVVGNESPEAGFGRRENDALPAIGWFLPVEKGDDEAVDSSSSSIVKGDFGHGNRRIGRLDADTCGGGQKRWKHGTFCVICWSGF